MTQLVSEGGALRSVHGRGSRTRTVQATELLGRVPPTVTIAEAHHTTFALMAEGKNPIGVFLSQEIVRFNKLLDVVRATLKVVAGSWGGRQCADACGGTGSDQGNPRRGSHVRWGSAC